MFLAVHCPFKSINTLIDILYQFWQIKQEQFWLKTFYVFLFYFSKEH